MEICTKLKNNCLDSLLDSLNVMHSFKIIHGDIKPENIMWSSEFNKCVFIDFGFSRVLKEKPGEKTFTSFFGTFSFCS